MGIESIAFLLGTLICGGIAVVHFAIFVRMLRDDHGSVGMAGVLTITLALMFLMIAMACYASATMN